MTIFEDLGKRRELLIDAALSCSLDGNMAMCDMWCSKALAIIVKMMPMTLEEASKPVNLTRMVKECVTKQP